MCQHVIKNSYVLAYPFFKNAIMMFLKLFRFTKPKHKMIWLKEDKKLWSKKKKKKKKFDPNWLN